MPLPNTWPSEYFIPVLAAPAMNYAVWKYMKDNKEPSPSLGWKIAGAGLNMVGTACICVIFIIIDRYFEIIDARKSIGACIAISGFLGFLIWGIWRDNVKNKYF